MQSLNIKLNELIFKYQDEPIHLNKDIPIHDGSQTVDIKVTEKDIFHHYVLDEDEQGLVNLNDDGDPLYKQIEYPHRFNFSLSLNITLNVSTGKIQVDSFNDDTMLASGLTFFKYGIIAYRTNLPSHFEFKEPYDIGEFSKRIDIDIKMPKATGVCNINIQNLDDLRFGKGKRW